MAKNDGGSAFPQVATKKQYTTDPDVHSVGGMTLRDYFAAKFMQSIFSNHVALQEFIDEPCVEDDPSLGSSIATQAYLMADAMLVERAK